MKNIAQKKARKQPKIKTEMNGKGLTIHAGLLPVLAFTWKSLFGERILEAVRKERGQTNSISLSMQCKWWQLVDSWGDLDGTGCEVVDG